jgi:hypothetical protein
VRASDSGDEKTEETKMEINPRQFGDRTKAVYVVKALATSRKVEGSRPDKVNEFFQLA